MNKKILLLTLSVCGAQLSAFRIKNKSGEKILVCFVHSNHIQAPTVTKEAPIEHDSYINDINIYHGGKRITAFELHAYIDNKRQKMQVVDLSTYEDKELAAQGLQELCFEMQPDFSVKKVTQEHEKRRGSVERKRVKFAKEAGRELSLEPLSQKKDCAAEAHKLRLEVNKIYGQLEQMLTRIEQLEA